jgi:hypothetical protein
MMSLREALPLARVLSESLADCGHEIVQAELELAVEEAAEADAMQHLLKLLGGNAFLMLIAFHFVADQADRVQDAQNGIDTAGRPSQYERAFGRKDAMRLAKKRFRFGEMLQHGQHYDVIELSRLQRQRLANVGSDALPAPTSPVFYLIINANSVANAIRRVVQKGSVQPTSHVAHSGARPNMRIRSAKAKPRERAINYGVGHLFPAKLLQVVVADICAAAYP